MPCYDHQMHEMLTITRPDDWHVHLRHGEMLTHVVPHTATRFGRAMVMPNLSPPIITTEQALAYRTEILSALPDGSTFTPLMSLYLTDHTDPREVAKVVQNEHVVGFKLYPAGATTHSDSGVTRISKIMPVLEAMAEHDVVLQVHGEVTDPNVDIFDREAVFIEQILIPLQRELPTLRIVLEHVTTEQGVAFVQHAGERVAATITVHHLLLNRNDMFVGGIRPHSYCLPVLKREHHRLALLSAATSADPSFFAGTDSAPHVRDSKENGCGCAGIYSAHAAIELYADIFSSMNTLEKLEGFVSHYGADFYGIKRNTEKITLERNAWRVPQIYSAGHKEIIPLKAGEMVNWSIAKDVNQQ